MRYLCLIYHDEKAVANMNEQEMGAIMEAYGKYSEDLEKAGAMLGGEALQPTDTATTVQLCEGKTMTTDGPFAETKEQLGGFYMIEAKDLDEAFAWAAKIPSAADGSIEIRLKFGPSWNLVTTTIKKLSQKMVRQAHHERRGFLLPVRPEPVEGCSNLDRRFSIGSKQNR